PFDFTYVGFVEGDGIARGAADVIVTDGFTGNVALKTAEGLARLFRNELRAALGSSVLARAGAFVAQAALRRMSRRLDPAHVNGGPFLGLCGIVVKSHGGADARGFANAVRLAADLARARFDQHVRADLERALSQGHIVPPDQPLAASLERTAAHQ
ncbi:MAG: phosphate acyltransferase, partial [Caulobacteraceae bacterium]|nr:phosphate acyltransferase [Caulobacteraceae bacterium]